MNENLMKTKLFDMYQSGQPTPKVCQYVLVVFFDDVPEKFGFENKSNIQVCMYDGSGYWQSPVGPIKDKHSSGWCELPYFTGYYDEIDDCKFLRKYRNKK